MTDESQSHPQAEGEQPTTEGVGHAHAPHLAHHFETPQQQYDTSKLGMWLFLSTELLMFSGLFCAYAIYRGNHPDVFLFAQQALNTPLALVGTFVLLLSSFTMSLAVRAASLGNKVLLSSMLVITLLGAIGFAAVEGTEYYAMWQENIFVGGINVFYQQGGQFKHEKELPNAVKEIEEKGGRSRGESASVSSASQTGRGQSDSPSSQGPSSMANKASPKTDSDASVVSVAWPPQPPSTDRGNIAPPPDTPIGTNPAYTDRPIPQNLLDALVLGTSDSESAAVRTSRIPMFNDMSKQDRDKTHIFFQLFFLMTGLHLTHVLVGMGLIVFVIIMAFKGTYGPQWYTPVDIVGLYWHLVDLVWVFLFPLLYLIH